jgi:hypothetical protein
MTQSQEERVALSGLISGMIITPGLTPISAKINGFPGSDMKIECRTRNIEPQK